MPKTTRNFLSLLTFALFIFIWGLFPNLVLVTYSKGVYPYLASGLRWVSSVFPFALGDLLYLTLIGYLIMASLRLIWKLRRDGWQKAHRTEVPLTLANTCLIFYISFKLLWGLNYSRPTITSDLKLSNEKYSVNELIMLGNFFINRVNNLQPQATPSLKYNINQLKELATRDYGISTNNNSFFTYRYPAVKPVFSGWFVSKIGIEGYYNPLSGEANVNMKLPAWVLPFVTYHEIAHQLGVAREDEANLVAYLVGFNSKNADVRYAVNYNMLRYILLEIRFKSPENYILLRDRIAPAVLANFKAENDFWAQYDGHMSNYMGQTFDKFLKLNNQENGIKSYQNIVVWLWNIHKKELRRQ